MNRFVDVVFVRDTVGNKTGDHRKMTLTAAYALLESGAVRFGKPTITEPKSCKISEVLERNNYNEMRSLLAELVAYSTRGMKKPQVAEALHAEKSNRH
jgi:hypothetical protein